MAVGRLNSFLDDFINEPTWGKGVLVCACRGGHSECFEYARDILTHYRRLDYLAWHTGKSLLSEPTQQAKEWQFAMISGCEYDDFIEIYKKLEVDVRHLKIRRVYIALTPEYKPAHLESINRVATIQFKINNIELIYVDDLLLERTTLEQGDIFPLAECQRLIKNYLLDLDAKFKQVPAMQNISIFTGVKKPAISLVNYYTRMSTAFNFTSNNEGLLLIGLLITFEERVDAYRLDALNVHRIMYLCADYIHKFYDDVPLDQKSIAWVGGISTTELYNLEVKFLSIYFDSHYPILIHPDTRANVFKLLSDAYPLHSPTLFNPASLPASIDSVKPPLEAKLAM